MKKKTINRLFTNLFWFILSILPILIYLLYIFAEPSTGSNVINFSDFLNTVGFSFVSENVLYSSLVALFGTTGTFPIFSTSIMFDIAFWFISVYLIRLVVEFVLFIPKFALKFLNSFTKED